MGTRERIAKAKTKEDVVKLRDKALAEFKWASDATLNAIKNTAARRLKELGGEK